MTCAQVLSLIEENTAAALHYGIDRVFEEPNTVVYYNMGASAVQVRRALSAPYMRGRYLSLPTWCPHLCRRAGVRRHVLRLPGELQMGGWVDVRRRGRRRSCPLTCL